MGTWRVEGVPGFIGNLALRGLASGLFDARGERYGNVTYSMTPGIFGEHLIGVSSMCRRLSDDV